MKFTLPDQLPATSAELAKLDEQAVAEMRVFQARRDAGEELSTEDVDRINYLADSRATIATATAAATEAEQAHASNVAAALDKVAAATAPKPEAKVEAPAEPEAEKAADQAAAEVVAEAEKATADAADNKATVSAGVKTVSFANAVNSDIPDPGEQGDAPKTPWQMAPSAPKYEQFGTKKVDTRTLAEAIDTATLAQFTGGRPSGTKTRRGQTFASQAIASVERPSAGPVIENAHQLHAALDAIGKRAGQRDLAKGLVAAGGWVSPSELLYDFCPTPAAGNLASLPEIPIIRGGIKFAAEPDFSELLTGFHFTEAELEAETDGVPDAEKEFVEVPGVDDFVEYRLEAIGWAVKAGILQRQGWPELIQKFIDEFMVAHQYRVSALTVTKMLGESDAARTVPTSAVLGATTAILNGLHVRARNLQLKTRIPTVEGIAPVWFRDVLRADLAMRDGLDALDVTDAQVDGWLAARGIYLQYEHTWQSLASGKPGDYDTDWWPGSVDVILYPAGTFFRSLNNVITFGVQYPMEQLQLNRYTHGFVEDSFLVGKRCYPSHLIRIPLCENGAVGARESIDCTGPYAETVTKTVTITGTPTGGTFKLRFSANDIPTATINHNASAANVKTALVAIDDAYVAADFATSGGALPGTAVVVTYPAALGDLEVDTNSLTGGTDPEVTVS